MHIPPYCPAWGLERDTKVWILVGKLSSIPLHIRPPVRADDQFASSQFGNYATCTINNSACMLNVIKLVYIYICLGGAFSKYFSCTACSQVPPALTVNKILVQ